MKTKIIYISGSEVFNITDIRSAFEEVRSALALGPDTVLFGVPVDTDDVALGQNTNPPTIEQAIMPAPDMDSIVSACPPDHDTPAIDEMPSIEQDVPTPVMTNTPIVDIDITDVNLETDTETIADPEIDIVTEPAIDTPIPEPAEKPMIKAKSRTRRRTRDTAKVSPIIDDEITPCDSTPDGNGDEKIVPILSVLAAQTISETSTIDPNTDDIPSDDTNISIITSDANDTTSDAITITSVSINDIDIDDIPESDNDDDTPESITDMITDDAPEDNGEKTLEELLEQMTPLRPDHDAPTSALDDSDMATDDVIPAPAITAAPMDLEDTDATLAQLASEFVETKDKIVTDTTPDGRGKIGKLKNILPFKKAKREDPGLMGDLFGWAGIAANDDEFSIPGFFTGASAKK